MRCTLAMMMLTACALAEPLVSHQPRPASPLAPARLAIYYGYPSLVNGASGDIDRAISAFADYDVIVFGDGLEFSDVQHNRMPRGAGAEEHRRTRAIIESLRRRSPSKAIYGYIDLGNSQKLTDTEVLRRARLWKDMGATGIFLDEAGYDFGVSRHRQNAALDGAHAMGLSVFMNAFDPADVFGSAAVPLNAAGGGNPAGAAPRIDGRDAYLLESFQVRLGELEQRPASSRRTAAAVKYRERFKTRIFGVTTTTADTARVASSLYEFAWWSAAVWGLDGFGWGEPDFSGATSKLPARNASIKPDAIAGTRFVSAVIETSTGYERETDAGRILLNRVERTGRFLPR